MDHQHNYGAIPLLFASLFWFPFASLPFPFTYLETLLDVIGSRPPWSQVARKLISPFPSPPHSKIPTPWGFPELNMCLTKTTSRIRLTRSGTTIYRWYLAGAIFSSGILQKIINQLANKWGNVSWIKVVNTDGVKTRKKWNLSLIWDYCTYSLYCITSIRTDFIYCPCRIWFMAGSNWL